MSSGPYKVFATGAPDAPTQYRGRQGWYFPLFLDNREAMKEDIRNRGKGIYGKISFLERRGEFYYPESLKDNLFSLADPIIYDSYDGNGTESKFSRIQDRLSSLVPTQLPDFLQTEYGMFVEFLKAYYKFLEQNEGAQEVLSNIRQYNNIDSTSKELVEKFFNYYAHGYNKSNITDNNVVLKNMLRIYENKGTEEGYRILFNILFKETIDFFYPGNYILKVSDGKWKTGRFIRSIKNNNQQNYYLFEDTEIRGLTSNTTALVTNVVKLNIGPYEVYEFEIDPLTAKGRFTGERVVATKAIIDDSNNIVTANLVADIDGNLISRVIIGNDNLGNKLRTRRGYTPGQTLVIGDAGANDENPGGVGALVKVKSVDAFSRIKEIDVLDPGINYSTNVVVSGLNEVLMDHAYYVDDEDETVVFFEKRHDYRVGDILDLTVVGFPGSNLLGQYFLSEVNSIKDEYTVSVITYGARGGIGLVPVPNPIALESLSFPPDFANTALNSISLT